MKKLIFLLLCTVSIYGQTSNGSEQEFDYGIKNNSAQTITTPPYLTTTGMDGTQGKIPSALIEKTDNKQNSLAVDGTGTKYPTVDAVFDALALKANIGNAFTAGRVPYTSSASAISDSSKLLWNNTNSYFEVNGNAPRFTLKNNLNNYSTYFTNNTNGALFLKNHQDKTLAVFSNPVNSTSQPQMAIGNVSSIPVESQLYVYGGMNGANIDARGSVTTDEANIDLEGADWETNPNSIGLSYFGSNATSFGTVLGYPKNKLGIIRFQDTNYAIINSDKSTGVSPIRFGINQIEIGNVNDKGFSYQSDFSSVNSSNPRWLADKGYVDTKAPLSSPTFTGTPTAPTAPAGTNTTQIATTAFVNNTSNLKEDLFNKQNSLAVDGTNTKYPTVTAVNAGLALKSNNNAVVHLTGEETITGQKTFSPTISASGAIARGTYLTPSLTATANNDVLVGLDINTTFTNGAFTGTKSLPVRVTSNQYIGMNVSRNSTGGSAITISNNNGGYNFGVGSINEFFIQRAGGNIVNTIFSTGNSIIQNGGTFTDDLTNRLQVTGTVSSGTTALGNTPPTANNQLTRKDYVDTGLALKANLASPSLTGTPTAPTAPVGTNTTQIATMEALQAAKQDLQSVLEKGNETTKPFYNLFAPDGSNSVKTGVIQVSGLPYSTNGVSVINSGQVTDIGFAVSSNGGFFVKKSGVINSFLGFNFPDKSNPSYPAPTPYTLATTDDFSKRYTVSSLPTPTGSEPVFAIVTDALAPTYMATVVGGGTVVCPVFYNGTAWVAH